MAAMSLKIT